MSIRLQKSILRLALGGFIIISLAGKASALCTPGRFMNPVTDICWDCMFPIKIGGIIVVPGVPDEPDLTSAPVCVCPVPPPIFERIGIPLSFWEPARYVETVKDPYCFPSLGFGLLNPSGGYLGGMGNSGNVHGKSFAQAHYFIYPIIGMMDLLVDSACLEADGFDVGFITEIDPTWNQDYLMAILDPKVFLVANPIAQMSCVIDSVASNLDFPLDFMFWCMGSWGSTYPVTGDNQAHDFTLANIGIGYRLLFKLAGLFLVCDVDSPVTLCMCTPTPFLIKSHYRWQEAMPVTDFFCHGVGTSDLIWGAGKNPPYIGMGTSADNFVWIIFRRHGCCAF
jgi:conjugal transfer pilus assembly protein TraU